MSVLVAVFVLAVGHPFAQNLSGEAIWTYDSDLSVGHVASAYLNGDLIPDVIAAEHNSTYYGNISKVFGLDGMSGDTIWTYTINDGARTMTVGDINGDGTTDAVIGCSYDGANTPDGRVHAIDGTDGSQLWTFYVGATISALAIGDFNGDDYMDVAAGSFDDNVYGINGQTGTQLWVHTVGSLWINAVSTGDVNGDNIDDVGFAHEYLAGFDNHYGILDGTNGSVIWDTTLTSIVMDVLLEDIDTDGNIEAVFSTITSGDVGYVTVLGGATGEFEWEASLGTVDHSNGDIKFFTYDVDEDSDLDLAVAPYLGPYTIFVFDGTSNTPMLVTEELDGFPRDLAFGDVTGEGDLDIVAAAYDRVQVVSAVDGKKEYYYSVAGTMSSVDVGDFDDDGTLDIAAGGTADASGTPPNPGKSVWAIKTVSSPLLWEYVFGEYGNAIAVDDLDGDEFMDVVAVNSVDDMAFAINGSNGTPLWTWTGTQNLYAVTTGDFNNDGQVDVAVAGNDDMVTALNGADGSQMWQFTNTNDQIYRGCLKAADLNDDGSVDVIVGSDDSYVYAINGPDGNQIWAQNVGARVGEIELGQMDNFGPIDVVVAAEVSSGGDGVVVLDGFDGKIMWSYTTSGAIQFVEVLDLGTDAILDVAAAQTPFGTKQVIMIDGVAHTDVWTMPANLPSNTHGMAHGDLNGDGVDDVVAPGSDGSVYALNGMNGSSLWTYVTGGEVNCVLVEDMDGDDQLDVVAGSDDQNVYVINGLTGVPYFNYSTADDVMDIKLGDIDGNGAPNIAAVTFGSDGVAYAFASFYTPEQGCCIGIRGNIDGDALEEINIADLVYYVDYQFGGGPAPICFEEADVDGTLEHNIADIVYMVDYMFGEPAGPAPLPCP